MWDSKTLKTFLHGSNSGCVVICALKTVTKTCGPMVVTVTNGISCISQKLKLELASVQAEKQVGKMLHPNGYFLH